MMEKHKCKLCFRNFSNGRALGGHMRSHMMNLHVPPKPNESPPPIQLSFEAESASSPSSSPSSSGDEEDDKNNLCYGLRENPKRSFRVADPEFSFAAAADTGSVILQDRESETESSKNVTRKRSKREWKLGGGGGGGGGAFHNNNNNNNNKKMKLSQNGNRNESASSVSDTTTEEDVAFCLMLLSRDGKWRQKHDDNKKEEEQEQELQEQEDGDEDGEEEDEEEEEEEEDEESDEYEEVIKNKTKTNKVRGGRYKCETCNKVFRSYQALGGHRASHKKIKLEDQYRRHEPELPVEHDDGNINNNNNVVVVASSSYEVPAENRNSNNFTPNNKKIHECPVCFRVFASGQALGGHKRTHVTTVPTTTTTTRAAAAEAIAAGAKSNVVSSSSTKFGRESLIDLNLPAPVDDDDVSQFEDSAVSDAEFVKPAVKIFPR